MIQQIRNTLLDTVLLRTDEAQFNKRVSLKSIIFNVEMDIGEYIIVFHKVPSRETFRKFIKAITEEYGLETYHAKYARSVTKMDLEIRYMYEMFNNKRSSKKVSKLCINDKPMFGCLFSIIKDGKVPYNKPMNMTLYKSDEQISILFRSIGLNDKRERTILVDFENIDF